MTGTRGRRLSVDADLEVSVDGVDATLVGRDGDLTLRTDDPVGLVGALRRSGLPPGLRTRDRTAFHEALGSPNVTIEGPRGRIVALTRADDRRGHDRGEAPTVRWYRPQDLVPAPLKWVAVAVVAVVIAVVLRRRN